jgi:hypothetical protein
LVRIVPQSKVPRRDYCPAAECRFSFDSFAKRLGARPQTFKLSGRDAGSYRTVWMELSSGRFANLTQTDLRSSVVEIGLEILDNESFFEQDLEEVIGTLGVDPEYVKRMRNEFKWIRSGPATPSVE